jgi:hypothetical protein
LNRSGNYIGYNALREYRKYTSNNSLTSIPIEDDGGGGTAGYHPEEGMEPGVSLNNRVEYIDGQAHISHGMDKELMTGWAEADADPEPLSTISIGMLQDIGYSVDYVYADEYIMYTVDGDQIQNATDGLLSDGEEIFVIFYENEKMYSTSTKGRNYRNRLGFNLYLQSEERYLKPNRCSLRVKGGSVKLSKITILYYGTGVSQIIYPTGETNLITDVVEYFISTKYLNVLFNKSKKKSV